MFKSFLLASLLALAFLVGCANQPASPSQGEARIAYVASMVDIDLVGTSEFRLRESGLRGPIISADMLQNYLRTLFTKHDNRYHDLRYTITLRSYDLPHPHALGPEAEHIAPVVAIARQYGCDVCVVCDDSAGFGVTDAFHEAFPEITHHCPR